MDYTTEIINISKINEGFFIGDQFAGTNPYLLFQFKISHIINAAGTQVLNNFESIGIKYLTLSWMEKPSQVLFDSKDEIANQIVLFIDNSLTHGEGLLAHSVRGQDRVCIVVLIYLMKKYNWTLKKSLEFLSSKKKDIIIPKYFMNQLNQFEKRLLAKVGKQTSSWNDEGIVKEEEKIMRNTYVNGLPIPKIEGNRESKHKNVKVGWSNNLITIGGLKPDLLMQRDIKPVTSHIRLRPSKSCIVNRNHVEEKIVINANDNNINVIKSNDDFNIGKITFGPDCTVASQIENVVNNLQVENKQEGNNNIIKNENKVNNKQNQKVKNTKLRANNFLKENKVKNSNIKVEPTSTSKRPYSSDKKNSNSLMNSLPGYLNNNKYPSYNMINNQNLYPNNTIIIANNFEQIVNNNINNIYIQNGNVINEERQFLSHSYNNKNNKNPIARSLSAMQQNNNINFGNNTLSVSLPKKQNSFGLSNKPVEKKYKVIDYTNKEYNNIDIMMNNYQPKIQKINPQSQILPSTKTTLNNFNPSLLRKSQNMNQKPNLFNRGSTNNKNAVK